MHGAESTHKIDERNIGRMCFMHLAFILPGARSPGRSVLDQAGPLFGLPK
jgi:hypothetical protein